jgi:hypothetical protein
MNKMHRNIFPCRTSIKIKMAFSVLGGYFLVRKKANSPIAPSAAATASTVKDEEGSPLLSWLPLSLPLPVVAAAFSSLAAAVRGASLRGVTEEARSAALASASAR